MRIFSVAILASCLLIGTTNADDVTFDFNIEDFGASAETVVDFDFDLGAVESIESVSIDLSHSWASDIDFGLTASNGDFFDLTSDNGGSGDLGDGSSSLAGVATYTFVEAAGNGMWGDGPSPFAAGTYDAETWNSGGWDAGTWNLSLLDDAGGDPGAVGSITVSFTSAIPEPTSGLVILGAAGLAAVRRRR